MGDFLDALAVTARETVKRGYYRVDYTRKTPPVSLRESIIHCAGNAVISEIKPASPSLGDIRPDVDPAKVAYQMEAGGAAGISVLTEPTHFKGSLDNLIAVRKAVKNKTKRHECPKCHKLKLKRKSNAIWECGSKACSSTFAGGAYSFGSEAGDIAKRLIADYSKSE